MERDPLEGLGGDFAAQRAFLADRSPAYAVLLDALEPVLDGEAGERLRGAWAQRQFGPWYERPLLLLSALRFDALSDGPDHPLWAAIAAPEPDPTTIDREKVESALEPERHRLWESLASRHVQTNETSRAVTWLWPAAIASASDPTRPLALYDIGASAGLNLVADRLPRIWERADGEPLELSPLAPISSRVGFDLRPLDARDPQAALWLLACVWPGQQERVERLEAAIEAFRELAKTASGPSVEARSADEVPEQLPVPSPAEPRVIAYATIMRDYLPADVRERYQEGMRDWLKRCPPGAALWAELEVTTTAREGQRPVDITVHAAEADGVASMVLAHCLPHPSVLEADPDAVERLARALS